MANWVRDKVFNNADDFLGWLDKNFGSYISKHISENHVHHTWKPDHANNRVNSTLQLHKNMRNFHVGTNGWADIAQHITIGSDGRIVLGRSITSTPVSATNYNGNLNWHPFAYEMIGNFDKGNDVLQGKQLESAIKISRYFDVKKGKRTRFHRELLLNGKQPKTCPGTGISKTWFMNLVNDSKFDVGKSINTSKVSQSPSSSVKSERVESTSRNYLQKGDKSTAVKNMQSKLIKAGYSLPKYGADGHFGEESELAVKALQKKNKLVVDGLFGQVSSTALDKEIKDKSKVVANTPKPKETSTKKGKYAGGDAKTTSVVDYLKSIKQPSSFNNRKKIANELGIKNYEGTQKQNEQLLTLMRNSGTASAKKTSAASKKSTSSYVGKRVESKVTTLRYYSKPSWADKDVFGKMKKGEGFTIVDKVKVGSSYQFKVKNSKGNIYYVTANTTFVTIK